MALQHHLFTFLTGFPAIVALVGTRIYPMTIPQNAIVPAQGVGTEEQKKPALVWRLIREPYGAEELDGETLVQVTLELITWGQTYESMDAVAEVVKDTLQAWALSEFPLRVGQVSAQTVTFTQEEDIFEETVLLYGRRQNWDFIGSNI